MRCCSKNGVIYQSQPVTGGNCMNGFHHGGVHFSGFARCDQKVIHGFDHGSQMGSAYRWVNSCDHGFKKEHDDCEKKEPECRCKKRHDECEKKERKHRCRKHRDHCAKREHEHRCKKRHDRCEKKEHECRCRKRHHGDCSGSAGHVKRMLRHGCTSGC